jgi:hypothetical protein
MNRCTFWARAKPLAIGCLLFGLWAHLSIAQTSASGRTAVAEDGTLISLRQFPAGVVRGTLEIKAPPDVLLDGKAERLSPGSRIRGPLGMFVLSASLVGQELPVVYLREPGGLLHEVWVLTEAEAQRMPIKPSYSR